MIIGASSYVLSTVPQYPPQQNINHDGYDPCSRQDLTWPLGSVVGTARTTSLLQVSSTCARTLASPPTCFCRQRSGERNGKGHRPPRQVQ